MRFIRLWLRFSRVVRATGSQWQSRNCPRFDPSIVRHSAVESEGRQMKQCWIPLFRKRYPPAGPAQEQVKKIKAFGSRWLDRQSLYLRRSFRRSCHYYACVSWPKYGVRGAELTLKRVKRYCLYIWQMEHSWLRALRTMWWSPRACGCRVLPPLLRGQLLLVQEQEGGAGAQQGDLLQGVLLLLSR